MAKRKAVGGDEQDAFSPWRSLLRWRPGEVKALKRKANKRERKQARDDIRREND